MVHLSSGTRAAGDARLGIKAVALGCLFVALGCGVSESEFTGVYSLATLNGQALPVPISTSVTAESQSTIELVAESLTLGPGRTVALAQLVRRTVDTVATSYTEQRSGTYDFDGTRLILRFGEGEVSTLALEEGGRTLRSSPGPEDRIRGVLLPSLREYREVDPR